MRKLINVGKCCSGCREHLDMFIKPINQEPCHSVHKSPLPSFLQELEISNLCEHNVYLSAVALCLQIQPDCTVADPGFSRRKGGMPNTKVGLQPVIVAISPENCMKLKKKWRGCWVGVLSATWIRQCDTISAKLHVCIISHY